MSRVFAYRNLNRRGVVWSIRDETTKRVVDRVHEAYFIDVPLKVSKSGRERVLREKRKNVHAGVSGTRVNSLPSELEWVSATYNPYREDTFVTSDGRPVKQAAYAKLTESGLYLAEVKS